MGLMIVEMVQMSKAVERVSLISAKLKRNTQGQLMLLKWFYYCEDRLHFKTWLSYALHQSKII
jgi:hypothetical protein